MSTAANEIEQFFKRYGTARVQLNLDDKFRLNDSALDVLFPLYETETSITFTQLGVRYLRDSERTIGNFGLGQRYFIDDFMIGYNGFFDYDFSRQHSRAGIGFEFAKDYIRLTANGYIRLSDWKSSKDFDNYQERVASGFDTLLEAYYPAYPQLGASLKLEGYFGKEVALISKDKLERNPVALTAGLNYTPIPLITMGAGYMHTNRSNHEAKFNLDLNYAIGVPLSKQINPDNVALQRSLMGSRYALVERNNNIVLEYKEESSIELSVTPKVTGYAGDNKALTATVTASNGVDRVEWDTAAIDALGGAVTSTGNLQYKLTLPAYQYASGAKNTHSISAIAFDRKGKSSKRQRTVVEVLPKAASAALSRFTANPVKIKANGVDASELTLTLKDEDGKSISGSATSVRFETRDLDNVVISEITEAQPGIYKATLTGTKDGEVVVYPTFGGAALGSLSQTVLLEPGEVDLTKSHFDVAPTTIPADGQTTSALSVKVRDAQGNIVHTTVSFIVAGVDNTTVSSVSESNGTYSATLKGTTVGAATVTPIIGGTTASSLNKTVNLVATAMDANKSTFAAEPARIKADNQEKSTLTLTAKDANGNLIIGLSDVRFDVKNITDYSLSAVKENNGVYTATLSGKKVGVAAVTPVVDGASFSGLAKNVTLTAGNVAEATSTFTATPSQIEANDTELSTLTLTLKDENSNPVSGLTDVAFSVAEVSGTTVSAITEQGEGIYSATLKGKTVGKAMVTPSAQGKLLSALKQTVILNAKPSKTKSLLTVTPDATLNPGAKPNQEKMRVDETHVADVVFELKDDSGNAVVTDAQVSLTFTAQEKAPDAKVINVTSEGNGTYKGVLVGTKIGKGTVNAVVKGENFKQQTVSLIAQDAAIFEVHGGYTETNPTIGKAKIGEKLTLEVLSTDKYANPVNVTVKSDKAYGRSSSAVERVTLVLPKEEIEVNAEGKATFNVEEGDPKAYYKPKGTRSEVIVTSVDGKKSETVSVIFTIITSPDTPKANYWGHMADTIEADGSTFYRPHLSAEMNQINNSVLLNNESWILATWDEAKTLCPMGALTSDRKGIKFYDTYPDNQIGTKFGWPTRLNDGVNALYYWLSDESATAGYAYSRYFYSVSRASSPKTSLYGVVCMSK